MLVDEGCCFACTVRFDSDVFVGTCLFVFVFVCVCAPHLRCVYELLTACFWDCVCRGQGFFRMGRCHVQVQGLLLDWCAFFTVQLSVVDPHFSRKNQSHSQTK